jgi:hypothetical protein
MSYLEFSTSSLTDQEAEVIADAYFRASKDPSEMAKVLGLDHFDLNLLMHPIVKAKIIKEKLKLNKLYSLEDHVKKLQEIRDGAMDDENWKTALSAEVAVGKAAGLYEPKTTDDSSSNEKPEQLSTQELRRRLGSMGSPLPAQITEKILDELEESEEVGDTGEI